MHRVLFCCSPSRAAVACCLLISLLAVSVSPVRASAPPDFGLAEVEPAQTDAIAVDVFVGLDFAEFWWDSAAIPGCANVLIKRGSQEIASVPCSTQPWRDSGLSAGTGYTYGLEFKDAGDSVLGSASPRATPGSYYGKLHTNLAISGGTVTVGRITVMPQAELSFQGGAQVTGGFIFDDANREAGSACSGSPGSVDAAGAAFQDTEFYLCNAGSSFSENSGNAKIFLFAAALVKDSTLGSIYADIPAGGQAMLQRNTFPSGGVLVDGSSDVYIADCEFQQQGVTFRAQSAGVVDSSRFDLQGTPAILLSTNGDVDVTNNEIEFQAADQGSAAIAVEPGPSASQTPQFTIEGNTLLGNDQGLGIAVRSSINRGDADVAVTQNTISRFRIGVQLDDGSPFASAYRIAAVMQGNTIVNSTEYAVTTRLAGSEDSVRLTNNCISDNEKAFYCANPDIMVDAAGNFWGHEDGPRHESNPDGKGGLVICNADQIDVSTWLADHACAVIGLDIWGIEVVQSVQTISNTVPLVKNKDTLVRVYAGVETGSAGGITGELTAFRNGTELGTLQSQQSVRAGIIDDWGAVRGDLSASLNYVLPRSWLDGQVDLVARLAVSDAALSAAADLPEREITAGFSPRRVLKIAYIPVTVDTGARVYSVNAGDILALHQAIKAVFPLGDVEYKIYPEETIFYGGLPLDDFGNATGNGFTHFSRQVKAYAQKNGGFEADLTFTVHSIDGINYGASTVQTDLSVGQCSIADGAYPCLYVVGLNLGLRSIRTEDPQNSPDHMPSYAWPYADGRIHDYGYDVAGGAITTPDYWDIMSQEAQLEGLAGWISPFHYQRAFTVLDPDASVAAAQVQPAVAALWVTGLAGKTSGHLYPVTPGDAVVPNVTPETPGGAWCVQALSGAGAVLSAYCFDLDLENPYSGVADGNAAFGALLPVNAATKTVRLRFGGKTLAQIVVPNSPPPIELVSAGYAAQFGALDVAWKTDLDGASALRYTFLYSADDGATWETLAVHPDRINHYDGAFHWGVRGEQIPPSAKARVRIGASNGYHTTWVTSGRFTMPDLGPWAGIISPGNNTQVDTLPLTLHGFAYDVSDGDRGATIVWRSSLDGSLGNGASVAADGLSSGWHTITLTATDAAGNTSSATVRVGVKVGGEPDAGGHATYLPCIQR